MTSLRVFTLAVLSIFFHSVFGQVRYTVTDLGTLGGTQVFASAINKYGQVAGTSTTTSGATHAFLYSGKMYDLGTLGGPNSYAYDINDRGMVAGYSDTATGQQHAFLFYGKKMHDLGALDGTASYGYGLNNRGEVIGYIYNDAQPPSNMRPFIYDSSGMHYLGNQNTFAGAQYNPQKINNYREVVGWDILPPRYYHTRSFLYYNGTVHDLGTVGGTDSAATGINAAGVIVGYSTTTNSPTRAYLFDGTMHNLGTGPGGLDSFAYSINSANNVVGYYTVLDPVTSAEARHAFLYDGTSMRDLNAEVSPLANQLLVVATGINDAGQLAVYGNSNGGCCAGPYKAYRLDPIP